MGLVAVIGIYLNLPGQPHIAPDILGYGKYGPHFEPFCYEVRHGWPLVFLTHEGMFAKGIVDISAWKIGEVLHFRPGFLALNVLFLLVITSTSGWLAHRHIQKYGWGFGLHQMILAMLILCCIAAFATHRYRTNQQQHRFLASVGDYPLSGDWRPFDPLRLRWLTGLRPWDWGDELIYVIVNHSNQLRHLPGKSSIEAIWLDHTHYDDMDILHEFENLKAIDICLGAHSGTQHLNEDGEPAIWPLLRMFSQLPDLQGINLYDCDINDRDLQELATAPNLLNLELSSNLDVTDEGIRHLASVKSLRILGLWDTQVTAEGVEKLQAELPDCEIYWDGMPRQQW